MCQMSHIAVNKIKLLLSVELTFLCCREMAEGLGVCGMMRTTDKQT